MRRLLQYKPAFIAILYKCVVVFCLCCLLLCNAVFAKKPSAKAGFVTKFPFILIEGGIIIVKATIGNFSDSLNFVLDTGCTGISLDSSTAETLQLATTTSTRTINGIAQLKQAKFIINQDFHLPNVTFAGLEYHINDYAFLSDTYGVTINGVLGSAFFKSYVVKIDYDKQLIEVWEPGSVKYPKDGSLMPLYFERLPLMNAHVNEKNSIQSRYIFDTGADMCLFLADTFVADSNVLNTNKKTLAIETQGPGGSKTMQYTPINEIQVGKYSFKHVPSLIFKDDYNVTLYPKSVGIIGSELLHRFNLIINFPDKKIHLIPNTYFKEPFNYKYTGFNILDVNGHITVEKVLKNSPADKAGLQQGDIVLGVNDNFSNDIEDLKKTIRSTPDNLKVSVLRNNQVKLIVVAIESLI